MLAAKVGMKAKKNEAAKNGTKSILSHPIINKLLGLSFNCNTIYPSISTPPGFKIKIEWCCVHTHDQI